MKANSSSSRGFSFRSLPISLLTLLTATMLTTACGSNGSGPQSPTLQGNTNVTVLLSSTANDQLQKFYIGLTQITLTSRSGKKVPLLAEPAGTQQNTEFIHINGGAEPLITTSIPQDVYVGASVMVGQSAFSCVTLTPGGGLDTSIFAYGTNPGNAPATTVLVNLRSPITVSGSSMGLLFDLQVAQSATFSNCYNSIGTYSYSITPTFNLTPLAFASQATNTATGKVNEFEGQITAIAGGANSFSLTLPEGLGTIAVGSTARTAFQGISGFSSLAVGMFVDMDGAVQSDGSLLATRIAAYDPSAADVQVGPVLIVGGDPLNGQPSAWAFNRLSQGKDQMAVTWPYNVSSAAFQISGELNNLQALPFVPSFSASNIVAGQNVYISTRTFQSAGDPYTPASTVTLVPQTINGMVVGASAAGSFTEYTVSFAGYDLFPTLAVQQGQKTLLSNPGEVEVYVDNHTQQLNTQPLTSGSTLRFYGLVFNDSGVLRMDCAQVNDGVTATSQSSSGSAQVVGRSRVIRRLAGNGVHQIITTIAPQ